MAMDGKALEGTAQRARPIGETITGVQRRHVISVSMSPALFNALVEYARSNRRKLSSAAAILLKDCLLDEEDAIA